MGFTGFWGMGFRVSGSVLRVWGFGFRVRGLGFRVSGLGFRVWGLGFRVWGLGFRVSGLGFRVQGEERMHAWVRAINRDIEAKGKEGLRLARSMTLKCLPP